MKHNEISKMYRDRLATLLGITNLHDLTSHKRNLWDIEIYQFSREHHLTTKKPYHLFILVGKDIIRVLKNEIERRTGISRKPYSVDLSGELPKTDNRSGGFKCSLFSWLKKLLPNTRTLRRV